MGFLARHGRSPNDHYQECSGLLEDDCSIPGKVACIFCLVLLIPFQFILMAVGLSAVLTKLSLLEGLATKLF
jgi:hypothetical protein